MKLRYWVVVFIGLAAIGYAGSLQLVYLDKRQDTGEAAATAWVHSYTGWMFDDWSEALAKKMNQNFLDDQAAKHRREERLKQNADK